MIGRLTGELHQVDPGTVLVDVGGVGYLVSITLRAFDRLAGEARASLWIHTLVRDDAIVLYGFPQRAELAAFEQLIGVAGVGPRTALAVLSALSVTELAAAVEGGDRGLLERTPGVGRKTAERILLELRGRLDTTGVAAAGAPSDRAADAVSALVNLGYPERAARGAVEQALGEAAGDELGEILRLALRRLTR